MTDYVVGTGNNGTVTLRVTQSSQDVASNGSTDHWELWLSSSYRNTYQNSAKACQVQINGNVYNGTFTFNFNNYTDLLIMSGDTWVPHNADGTKSTAVYGYIAATGTSSIGGPASVSGTFYQSTIPRASTATLSGNPVDAGSSVTIYTNRASTSFTHTIEYYFGSASGTIGTAQAVTDSIAWSVPTSLMDQIPNSTSGVGTIRCHTYSSGTYIGYKDTSITITVPSTVVPTIGDITITEATAGLAANVGAFVQSLSKFTLTMTGVTYPYSATQVSAKLTVNGQTINSTTGTTPATISAQGTVPVVATVTDSRGRVGTKTVNATVMAYVPPTITTVTTQRALSTGTPDDNGTYILTSLNAAVQSLIVGGTQKNAINYRISTRLHGTSTWTVNTAVVPGGVTFNGTKSYGTFPINSSYDVLVEVFDDFITTAQQLSVPTSTIFMHWDSTLGIGVGKYREQGQLDVEGQIYQNSGSAVASQIQLWTTVGILPNAANLNSYTTPGMYHQSVNTQAASGTNYPVPVAGVLEVLPTGNGSFVYQRYTPYGANNNVFVRRYYNSVWYAWEMLLSDRNNLAKVCRLITTTPQDTGGTAGVMKNMIWTSDSANSGMWTSSASTFIFPNKAGWWKVMGKARFSASTAGAYLQVRMNDATNSPSESLETESSAGPYPIAHDIFLVTNPGSSSISGSDYFTTGMASLGTYHGILPANCLMTAEYIGPA